MKRLWFLCLLIMPLLVAAPQETAPPGFEHWTVASLKALTQALSTEAAADPHRFAVNQLKDFPAKTSSWFTAKPAVSRNCMKLRSTFSSCSPAPRLSSWVARC